MALSKTHILLSALAFHRKRCMPELRVPFVVLPDAIRCFNYGNFVPNNRVITHFEIHPVSQRASWIRFPSIDELKTLDDDKIQSYQMEIESDYNQVAIGDETSIETFKKHNLGLEPEEFLGIHLHLEQDKIYDEYVRQKIDCTERQKGIFKFKGKIYDPIEVRKLITEIEEQEFRILVKKVTAEMGIIPDINWFEKNVFVTLRSAYCTKMAECTINNIKVDLSSEFPCHLSDEECNGIVEKMLLKTEELL